MDLTLSDFTAQLASAQPAPGGGGAAALTGALAASLTAMAANVTAANPRYAERSDALRKPARFAELLQACESDARGRLGLEAQPYPQAERLRVALAAARSVDAGAIARGIGNDTEKIKEAVHRARIEAVAQALAIGE